LSDKKAVLYIQICILLFFKTRSNTHIQEDAYGCSGKSMILYGRVSSKRIIGGAKDQSRY